MKHFIVIITLNVSQDTISPRKLYEHEMFFRAGFSLGLLLFYGPRNPPEGFIAVAKAESRHTLEWFLKKDPLLAELAATVDILEFQPAGFKGLLQDWMSPFQLEGGFGGDEGQGVFI